MSTELRTRRPSGKPSWPIVLIAGAEKAGKSWACAAASGSDLIGRTLWIGLGEDDPDEYANLYLAGDWTDNGMNCGAMESAVLGGLLAARAFSA